jgi:hypothetical protein
MSLLKYTKLDLLKDFINAHVQRLSIAVFYKLSIRTAIVPYLALDTAGGEFINFVLNFNK